MVKKHKLKINGSLVHTRKMYVEGNKSQLSSPRALPSSAQLFFPPSLLITGGTHIRIQHNLHPPANLLCSLQRGFCCYHWHHTVRVLLLLLTSHRKRMAYICYGTWKEDREKASRGNHWHCQWRVPVNSVVPSHSHQGDISSLIPQLWRGFKGKIAF